ncbi:MAG: DUF2510 domain-containing protein [Acidimicrobiales bacterium]
MTILETSRTKRVEPIQAGWHDDPMDEHAKRYFDGRTWTDHVTHYGPSPCSACGHLR